MAFIKALLPAILVSWIVSTLIGSQGSDGGYLLIEHVYFQNHGFYWSWPAFLAMQGLTWSLYWMMDN